VIILGRAITVEQVTITRVHGDVAILVRRTVLPTVLLYGTWPKQIVLPGIAAALTGLNVIVIHNYTHGPMNALELAELLTIGLAIGYGIAASNAAKLGHYARMYVLIEATLVSLIMSTAAFWYAIRLAHGPSVAMTGLYRADDLLMWALVGTFGYSLVRYARSIHNPLTALRSTMD
jgi:hypothetical protein